MRGDTAVITGLVFVIFMVWVNNANKTEVVLNEDGTADLWHHHWLKKDEYYPLKVIGDVWHYKNKNGEWVEVSFDYGFDESEELPVPLGR